MTGLLTNILFKCGSGNTAEVIAQARLPL